MESLCRAPRAWGPTLLVIASAACTADEVYRVALDDYAVDAAALVITDDADRPQRIAGLFTTAGGAAPGVRLDDGERAYLVGAVFAQLAAPERALTRADWSTFEIEVRAPPPSPERILGGGELRVRFALPTETLLIDPERDAPPRALLGGLSASVTIRSDDAGPLALRAFGASSTLLAADAILPGEPAVSALDTRLLRALPLPDGRVLVASARFFALIERGQPLVLARTPGQPSPYLSIADVEPVAGNAVAADVAINRAGTRAWACGHLGPLGRVWIIDIGADGLRAVGTATIAPSARWPTPPQLRAVVTDARGGVLVGGHDAFLAYAAPEDTTFTARPRLLAQHEAWVRRNVGSIAAVAELASTDDPAQPHMVGVESGRLIVGDAAREEWSLELDASALTGLAEPHVTGIAHDDATGEAWVTTRGGGIMQRPRAGAAWVVETLVTPGGLEPCATASPDGGFSLPTLSGVALDDTHAYVVINGCTSLLRVRRDDGVASAIHRAGEGAERTEDTDPRAIVAGPRGPLVAGGRATVQEVRGM